MSRDIIRVLQAGKWNFERGQKRSKMTFLSLKMIIFGHCSRFWAFFKFSFSSLQHPNYISGHSRFSGHSRSETIHVPRIPLLAIMIYILYIQWPYMFSKPLSAMLPKRRSASLCPAPVYISTVSSKWRSSNLFAVSTYLCTEPVAISHHRRQKQPTICRTVFWYFWHFVKTTFLSASFTAASGAGRVERSFALGIGEWTHF